MAVNDRDEIVAALKREEERLSTEVHEAREKAKAVEKELKGIRSALAALTNQSNGAAKKESKQAAKPSSNNGGAKPAAKRQKKQAQGEPA